MTYDPTRARTVLFGGRECGNYSYLGDTWEWSGTSWTARTFPVAPSARSFAAITYDEVRNVTILFGGSNGTPLGDTWQYDGQSWTPLTPAVSPAPSSTVSLAFDKLRGKAVLFNGTETWEWNGAVWERRAVGTPSFRSGFGLAYDSRQQKIVLYGGGNFGNVRRETWEWDGTSWMRSDRRLVRPQSRSATAISEYPDRDQVVMFGGRGGSAVPVYLSDTWTWTAAGWFRETPPVSPAPRHFHAMAYDPTRHEVVLFGGGNSSTSFNDTWTYSNGVWSQRTPLHSPGPGTFGVMAYDSRAQALVFFGGQTGSPETWRWDGSDWTQLSPVTPPPNRFQATLTNDPVRNRVVLFGGLSGSISRGDLWEWSISEWAASSAGTAPSPRYGHSATFNAARQKVLVFGGITDTNFSSTTNSDTWEWDGASWVQLPVSGPLPRSGCGMAYHNGTTRIVMFGGRFSDAFDETWTLSSEPPVIQRHPRSRVVVQGDYTDLSVAVDASAPVYQWLRGTTVLADDSDYSGTTSNVLRLSSMSANSIGLYSCRITDACANSVVSDAAALVFCQADYDADASVTVGDLFAFLSSWFENDSRADFNGVGGVTVQDIFDFLNAWFSGCI